MASSAWLEMLEMYKAAVELCKYKENADKKSNLEERYAKRFLYGFYACNPLLRLDLQYFNEFVTSISLKTRLKFLHISMDYTYRELAEMLGYPSHSAVQNILSKNGINNPKLLAELAILYRVPPNWLINENCSQEWIVSHFFDLKTNKISLNELLTLLEQTTVSESWIRFYIIYTSIPDTYTFLRIECQKGNFLIEFFNKTGSVEDILDLSNSLRKRYHCLEGLIITPVLGRENRAFICVRNENGTFSVPVGFRLYK